MAQLIKLSDYVSRYENDLTRYPTQFIRLKRYQWKRVKLQWENGLDLYPEEAEEEREKPDRWYSALFNKLRRKQEEEAEEIEKSFEEGQDMHFQTSLTNRAATMEQLKRAYRDQLFNFQLKWASSTLYDRSRVDPKFFRDDMLKQLTLRLPDSFLLLYYPIIRVNKAPVELDIILLAPNACYCITVLDGGRLAAFIGSGERFWLQKTGSKEKKVLNPSIALGRMEKILSSLFRAAEVDLPIKKLIVSQHGYIDYPGTPFEITTIDRKTYEQWIAKLCSNPSPMKHTQFKAAQAILDHAQTTAMSRLLDTDETAEESAE